MTRNSKDITTKEVLSREQQQALDGKAFAKTASNVAIVSIVVNLLLSVGKMIAGIVANSNAMISDAIHSASDVFSSFVVIIGVRMSARESDKSHPYGHERLECEAAIILAIVLFITGLTIGLAAVKTIMSGQYQDIAVPGKLALIAAAVSIAVKEGMYWFTRFFAKKIDSGALMADAWHHRTDAFSSVGALIGIAFARMGYPIMDSVASLIIFVFIVKASYDIFKDAMDKMVDHSADKEMENQMRELVSAHPEVVSVDLLTTRIFGNKVYVDLEISVNGFYTLFQAHDIAEVVHDDIEKNFPKVKHIMVHVNPDEQTANTRL